MDWDIFIKEAQRMRLAGQAQPSAVKPSSAQHNPAKQAQHGPIQRGETYSGLAKQAKPS